jgi:2-phospho-L-lactate guanylyltransferase
MIIWAIIPVKPLRDSKSRLAHILSSDQRAELTSQLLGRTLDTLNDVMSITRTLVVSRDPAALKVARRHGAFTFGETEKQDLNLALTRASHIAVARKANCVLILPSDLPLVTKEDVMMMVAAVGPAVNNGRNGDFSGHRAMAICTDHMRDGTNALMVCPPIGFNFQYGPGSFDLHLDEAARLGMARRIVHAPGIKFDLDSEEDWQTYQALQPAVLAKHSGTSSQISVP